VANEKRMNPVSGDKVETDGVYEAEWGRQELLKQGDDFPSDVMMGDTEWKLVQLPSDEQMVKIENERGDKETRYNFRRGDK
jgi:hypothetical protein